MFNLGPFELVAIFVVALLVFGPEKLPEMGKQVGKADQGVPEVPGVHAEPGPRRPGADHRADHPQRQRRRPAAHQHQGHDSRPKLPRRGPRATCRGRRRSRTPRPPEGEEAAPPGTFGHYAPVRTPQASPAPGADDAPRRRRKAPPRPVRRRRRATRPNPSPGRPSWSRKSRTSAPRREEEKGQGRARSHGHHVGGRPPAGAAGPSHLVDHRHRRRGGDLLHLLRADHQPDGRALQRRHDHEGLPARQGPRSSRAPSRRSRPGSRSRPTAGSSSPHRSCSSTSGGSSRPG